MNSERFNPRMLCFDMLFEVYERSGYAQLVLKHYFKKYPSAGSRDKGFVTALFYGVITRTFTLDYLIERKIKGTVDTLDPVVRTALRMGVWQIIYSDSIPNYAAVNTSVHIVAKHGTPGAKALVNAVLRSVAKEEDVLRSELESAKPYVRFSMSREITGLLIKWYGISKAESIAAALLGESRVTARANLLRCTRSELKTRLEGEGVRSDPGRFYDRSLTLHLNGIPIESLAAYRDGLFMIQDEAAMLVGILAHPQSGQRILDVCAAPGGKSCHLAEIASDDADILALDIHKSRLKLIEENTQRLGIRSVRTAISDASDPDHTVVGTPGSYDIVLADVPCSGLGLMKRKPDIRLTSSYDRIMSLLDIQEQILDQSAKFVKPGGILMYSTCTINPDENENRIEAFLDRHALFSREPLTGDLPDALLSLPRHVREGELGSLLLLPDDDDCDGFFISKMRRTA